ANQPGPGQYIATVALSGRAPVKVTNENGNIQVGDYITSSAKFPGYGMKATRSGVVIGQAIEAFEANGESSGKVEVFMGVGYQQVNNTFVLTDKDAQLTDAASGSLLQQAGTSSTSFVIDQQGTGDILKLQKGGLDKFLVKNDGSVSILTDAADEEVEVFAVSNKDQKLLVVKASGDVEIARNLKVKGSVEAIEVKAGNKLCLGTTCVDEQQLKALLENIGSSQSQYQVGPPPGGSGTPDPNPGQNSPDDPESPPDPEAEDSPQTEGETTQNQE
ncbi:MAG TPA: hypothetical protein VEA59_04855, partial [Patescibacteria group bacterium]|nr:hypothetical protein [Patescibacteria group bacterium]